MSQEIIINSVVTMFDGKNYWPVKVLKTTKTRATVAECDINGNVINGEPVSRKIDGFAGEPTVNLNRYAVVYLTRPYNKDDWMKYSDI